MTNSLRLSRLQLGKYLDHPLGNALWFNALWLSAVLGREDWIYLSLAFLLLQLFCIKNPGREIRTMLIIATLGCALDSLASLCGFYIFEQQQILPHWLGVLWIGFALSLGRSLHFFSKHLFMAVIFGALGGCMSYWSGSRVGAVSFAWPLHITLPVIALVWGIVFPCLLRLYDKLNSIQAGADQHAGANQ